jgi:DNA replication protein DnaC
MEIITVKNELIKLYAKQLKLPSFTAYEDVIRQLNSDESFDAFLVQLMKEELAQRQEKLQKRKIKAAKFPYIKTFDEFEFERLPNVSKAHFMELSNCDFIKNRENIVMIGNPGSGKSHSLLALGLKACQAGFNVRFYTAASLVNELSEALQLNRLSKFEKSLAKVDLLLIDELSYLSFNRHQSELLFQVISERSERGSVIVTTNLEFSKWTELFENEIMVSALIDRLTFRSHILNMNVDESYRYQETKKRLQQAIT